MNFTIAEYVREAVANGFRWLTGFYGDTSWVWRIDIGKLDMACKDLCVWGQLEGEWDKAHERYGLTLAQCIMLGLWSDGGITEYNALTREWKRAITDERNRLRNAVGTGNADKHPVSVTVEVMLTTEQIGRVYLDASERGITVEEYIANEVGYAADKIDY